MERKTKLKKVKVLFGKYFFGPDEITKVFNRDIVIPKIKYDMRSLKKHKDTHILILGTELSIMDMRYLFCFDKNPCFYNQDWYINEDFAKLKLKNKWYLLQKDLSPKTRGKLPNKKHKLPSAVLTTYTFFVNYIINNEILWENDYVWNSDKDNYGDRIYTGKYKNDIKDGFNIHRHLSIKNNYGVIKQL
jgi:hypothetical protein